VLGRSRARPLQCEQLLQIQIVGVRQGRHTHMLYAPGVDVNAR
jgi:hypothetical protein